MSISLEETKTHIGGSDCSKCKFWTRYTDFYLSVHSLPKGWGRCVNEDNLTLCLTDSEAFKKESRDRAGVDVHKLTVEAEEQECIITLSTSKDYSCPNFKWKPEEKEVTTLL